jgi:hypothetical protein
MNLFERYRLDPKLGLSELTKRLREQLEDAPSEVERQALREAWEALTKHPRTRVEAALLYAPRTPLPPKGQTPPMAPRPELPSLVLADFIRLPYLGDAWELLPPAPSTQSPKQLHNLDAFLRGAITDDELSHDPIWAQYTRGTEA